MQRIVLDTNVLVNGVQDDMSYAHRIIQKVISGELEGAASSAVVAENQHMAERLIADEEYLDLLDDYFDRLIMIEPKKRFDLSDDPNDNKFLDAAVAAEAACIISDDAHLLDLGDVEGVKILSPEQFINAGDGGETWGNMASMIGIG